MGRDEYRGSAGPGGKHLVAQRRAGRRVQSTERLVEYQECGIADQCAGEPQPPLRTVRTFPDILRQRLVIQSSSLERLNKRFSTLLRSDSQVCPTSEHVPTRPSAREDGELGDVRNAMSPPIIQGCESAHQTASTFRPHEAQENPEQGRLAGAVGAHDRGDLSGPSRKRCSAKGPLRPEELRVLGNKVLGRNQVFLRIRFSYRPRHRP